MKKLKIASLLLLLFLLPQASLKDSPFLTINDLSIAGVEFKNLQLFLFESRDHHTKTKFSIANISGLGGSDEIVIKDIVCSHMAFTINAIICKQGRGQFLGSGLYETDFDFSLQVNQTKNELNLTNLTGIDDIRLVQAPVHDGVSQLSINFKGVTNDVFKPLLKSHRINWEQGAIDVATEVMLSQHRLTDLQSNIVLKSISIQTDDGRYACEDLNLSATLNATVNQEQWHWQIQTGISHGEIYLEPIYHPNPQQTLVFTANGLWNVNNKDLKVNEFIFDDPAMGHLAGQSRITIDQGFQIEQATLTFSSENLQQLDQTYIQPFLTETLFEGLRVTGAVNGQVDFTKQSLEAVSIDFSGLNFSDREGRFQIHNSHGTINWSSQLATGSLSTLFWDGLVINQLPFGATEIELATDNNKIKLNHPINMPSLGGNVHVGQFDWSSTTGKDPVIHFQGFIEEISLAQLASVLKWPNLHGSISGGIPQIIYHQGELKTSGELWVEVFGGHVIINQLVLVDFLSSQPEVFANIAVDNLDLEQISQTFKAGKITGKLSGFINDLHLLAWRPLTFFAWLGTPENDHSEHQISQRALDNIASIGVGPGVGLLSTTFLSYFDLFGYDRLGMGCYLHQGVCQLMGVNAVNEGFYLVKGQGLPRVDVIAYNTELDFDVLLKRMGRITQAEF